jgi:hypothetical protein
MPPPRLPRHLRPCHPSGTAYQIRCAHRTTPVPPSTVGDESPQTTKTDSHNASKESWWSGTVDRIVPWARETSSTELQPPARPQSQSQTQNSPTLDPNEGKKDISEEQTSDTGSGLVRKSKESPAQRQRRILRLGSGAHSRDNKANKADSQSQRVESVRKVERILEGPLDQPTIVRKHLCLSASPTSTEHERKQQVPIRRVQQKHNPTTIAGETSTNSRNDDTTAIRQQLQGLFEQVKALQAALESKMALGQSSPTTRQEMNTPTAAPSIPRNDGQQSTSIQPLLQHASTTSNPVSPRRLKTSFPKTPSGTLEYTQKAFRESAYTIGQVATELETLSSSAAARVAWRARNCIRVLSEDAKVEGDYQLRQTLGVAYKNWETLHAERKYSARAYERPGLLLQLRGRDIKATSAKIRNDVKRLKKELVKISPTTPKQPKPVISSMEEYRRQACESIEDTQKLPKSTESGSSQKRIDGERLTRSIHTQSRWMKSSDDLNITTDDHGRRSTTAKQSTRTEADTPPDSRQGTEPSPATRTNLSPKPTPDTAEMSEQSLLEELFPEASSPPQPRQTEQSDRYPKLNLPDSRPIVRREVYDPTPSLKEQVVNSFRKQGEQITVLQLTNCSTELTEADFRRIIPKSKHIEGWNRDGDLYKVIPGRDPLSLERLPFYYLLFKNADAALAYQKNASRLHKLSALHQPASIFSAIPAPRGFLEDGEDITAAISSYNLLPTHHPMSLNVLMQPYNPQLRALIERGGYQPVTPSVDKQGKHIWRVLMHIEGYEPTTSDLFKIFSRDAYKHGMLVPLRNESQTSIHRLRDVINLRTSSKPISSSRPRAYGTFDQPTQSESEKVYDDPAIQSVLEGTSEDNPGQTSQLIMNRVYNRWVLDFEDEDTARRWSVRWHRRVLPELSHTKGAWRDSEEARVCNTELLW